MLPSVSHGANLFNLCPFPDSFALYVQNWFPIRPAVWPQFPSLLNCWSHKTTHNAALEYRGANCLSLCPFPDESTDVYQIWCQSVQPFDSFPRVLNVWPPNPPDMPPGVLRVDLYLAYAHSQMNPQTWTKVGANRSSRLTASADFWMFDPLKPLQVPPCVSHGNLFGVYPFPDESAHVYQMWCQSDQPDIFPLLLNLWSPNPPPPAYVHSQTNPQTCTKFGANRSSRLTPSRLLDL